MKVKLMDMAMGGWGDGWGLGGCAHHVLGDLYV
jgi:hypothetical protein